MATVSYFIKVKSTVISGFAAGYFVVIVKTF